MSAAMFASVKEMRVRLERLEAQVAELMTQLGQKAREIPAPHVAKETLSIKRAS